MYLLRAIANLESERDRDTDSDQDRDTEPHNPDESEPEPEDLPQTKPDKPEPVPESDPGPLTPLELPKDTKTQDGQRRHSGVRIRAEQDLAGLECRLSEQTSGVVMAYLKGGGGTILERRSIDTLEAGDTFRFTTDLESGAGYQIVCAAGSAPYNRGRSPASYPIESDALTATAGIYTEGGTRTTRYRYNIDQIRPLRSVEEDQLQAALGGGMPSDPMPDYHSATGLEAARAVHCHIVDDPAGGDGEVLRIHYPEGEILGANERVSLENAIGYEPKVAHARFELFFPEDWQPWDDGINGGTKLPGWADHRGSKENPGGAAGGNHNQGAYSTRMNSPCQGGTYDASSGAEVPFTSQVYDASFDPDEKEYGHIHCWTEGGSKGEWITIDYRITLNTPGEADGKLEGWVNGVKAWYHDEYLFLDEKFPDRGIPYWRRHYHFGGDWGSPEDNDLYERNLSIWVDDNVPEMGR